MEKLYDCIIVGSGPGGMTAAIYLKRNNLDVCVFEGYAPGGQMINTEVINNYPGFSNISGADLALAMFNQVQELNIDYAYENVTSIAKENDYFKVNNRYSKFVIIAIGTKNKVLGLPNEKKYFYKGISWCAICDGALYKGKDVCVVGGGDSALSSVITLSKLCTKVYLVHRRNEFRAKADYVSTINNLPNVEVILESNITDMFGDGKLESIEVTNNNGEKRIIPISCLFEEIGRSVECIFLPELEKDASGFIKVNSEFETNISGIYAIGDCIEKGVRQIATATADGVIAALSIAKRVK